MIDKKQFMAKFKQCAPAIIAGLGLITTAAVVYNKRSKAEKLVVHVDPEKGPILVLEEIGEGIYRDLDFGKVYDVVPHEPSPWDEIYEDLNR